MWTKHSSNEAIHQDGYPAKAGVQLCPSQLLDAASLGPPGSFSENNRNRRTRQMGDPEGVSLCEAPCLAHGHKQRTFAAPITTTVKITAAQLAGHISPHVVSAKQLSKAKNN